MRRTIGFIIRVLAVVAMAVGLVLYGYQQGIDTPCVPSSKTIFL